MKLKYEKNVRILNDLLGYCHYLGGKRFHVDFELEAVASRITVQAEVPAISEKQLRYMSKTLTLPRQFEMEQNYWNISGEEEIDGELMLAGMMVDDAVVEYLDGELTITVTRIDQSAEE